MLDPQVSSSVETRFEHADQQNQKQNSTGPTCSKGTAVVTSVLKGSKVYGNPLQRHLFSVHMRAVCNQKPQSFSTQTVLAKTDVCPSRRWHLII